MPKTEIGSRQIRDGDIRKEDMDITTSGQSVITNLILVPGSSGVVMSESGADTGTGAVTLDFTSLVAGGGTGGGFERFTQQTTDATQTTAASIPIDDDTTISFEVKVSAQGPTNKNYWASIEGGVRRSGGGSATLVGTAQVTSDSENSPSYVANVAVSGNNLLVQVTGEAAETVDWVVKVYDTTNSGTTTGSVVYDNDAYIQWRNAADTGDINVIKLDSSDDTIINSDVGNVIKFLIGSVEEVQILSTGLAPVSNFGSNLGSNTLHFGNVYAANLLRNDGGSLGIINTQAASIDFQTSGNLRWIIDSVGTLKPNTSVFDIGDGSNHCRDIYTRQISRSDTAGDLIIRHTQNLSVQVSTNGASRWIFLNVGNLTPLTDNAYSLGQWGLRTSSVWSANGTIQTSDQRDKNTITDSSLGLDFVNALRPVSYKWNVGGNDVSVDGNGDMVVTPVAGTRTHWGLLAQEVKTVVDSFSVDFGGWILTDVNDSNSQQALRYDQFIAPLIKAIQELSDKVDALELAIL